MSFEIVTIETEAAANPWTEAAEALLEAAVSDAQAGLRIVVPAGTRKDGSNAEGQKDRISFQNAARALGYTARIVSTEALEDGQYALTFKYTALNAARRGQKSVESDSVEAEAPTE